MASSRLSAVYSGVIMTLLLATVAVNKVVGDCDQITVNYISNNLKVDYEVVQNFPGSPQMRLFWTNNGASVIPAGGIWTIYFTHLAFIEPNTIRQNGTVIGTTGLKVFHVNGVLFRLEPTSDFHAMNPGDILLIQFEVEWSQVARTDMMPNWYVVDQDPTCNDGRVILSTSGESLSWVRDFVRTAQWKRSPSDRYDPLTAQQRFDQDYTYDMSYAPHMILPTPLDQSWDTNKIIHIKDGGWVVVMPADPSLMQEAQLLANSLNLALVSEANAPGGRKILLHVGDVQLPPRASRDIHLAESYELIVDSDLEIVNITGPTNAGVYYGTVSLVSLAETKDAPGIVPHGYVRDGPRFEYRGMHLDVSRNFHDVNDVMRLCDVMSQYKMNKLHLHLADDEGWRLEIPGIPELTDIGGKRCHDPTGDQCIMPQLGSGPTQSNAGTGYYTVAVYQSILRYAAARHIQVIPEFDMPGHGHAAINAMLARYRKYLDLDPQRATEFLLSDPADTSDYLSIQGFTDNAINPCIESTYHFIDTVIKAVIDLHADIQPLQVFHMGGDEVPRNAWTKSPACEALGEDPSQLKIVFLDRVAQMCSDFGIDLGSWEDGFYTNSVPVDRDSLPAGLGLYATVWDNVWEWGTGDRAYVLANDGYKVIVAHATNLYFDMPQEPDPEERGLYWATRTTSTWKVFNFIPDKIYENIDVDGNGVPLDRDEICANYGCPELDDDKRDNIVGIQGQLWSETVRTSAQLDSMICPRLLALAERAWHKAEWEELPAGNERLTARTADWTNFANTLGYKELARLDAMGVAYRVPPPGADLTATNEMTVTAGLPGLPMRYSINGGATWIGANSLARILLPADTEVLLNTASADQSRLSRQVKFRTSP